MKLAFVLFRYFPFGGMQRNMMSIATACLEKGHDVEVICSEWLGQFPSDFFPSNFKITRLGIQEDRHSKIKSKSNGNQMEDFFRAFSDFRKIHQYDCVVGFNKFPNLDAYYAADSCFATKAFEERSWFYRLTKRAKLYLEYEKSVFNRQGETVILEVSNKEREQFQTYYQTPSERFVTLPPGISKNRIAKESAKAIGEVKRKSLAKELNIDEDQTIFLAIGSGFKTKGLERSIQLVADIMSSGITMSPVLLVAGQDKANAFIRLAKKLGVVDRIKFLGGRDDVPDLLQAADVVLHPAHKENTGNVLLEAMVAGRPVVTTDVCGYAHYVEGADMGIVIQKPFTQKQYLDAVEQVLATNDSVWRERGKAFSKNEEIYSRPEFVAKVLEDIGVTLNPSDNNKLGKVL
ncbi:MAG: glycosyltransferase family 4 protein [Cellvibrionaceae bacterium]